MLHVDPAQRMTVRQLDNMYASSSSWAKVRNGVATRECLSCVDVSDGALIHCYCQTTGYLRCSPRGCVLWATVWTSSRSAHASPPAARTRLDSCGARTRASLSIGCRASSSE